MINTIDFEITPIDEAVEAILEKIKEYFLKDIDDKFLSPLIESSVAKLVDELRQNLYCVIEYPYVDKVYRDSFYHYYSSKHFTYQRDCIRIALFDGEITFNDFLTPENHDKLKKNFLGFFVIRPTINAIHGRSMISPLAFENQDFQICRCKTSCLVYGVKLEVEGFPFSSQDGETIRCAETTIWALMEYFGNRYAEYSPALPAKIHKALERFSYERQLPSNGLTMDQVSFALKEFGFGTRIYSMDAYQDELYGIIDNYIESGIPVLLGLQNEEAGHVIIAIGKVSEGEKKRDAQEIKKIKMGMTEIGYIETCSFPAKYIVQDDNFIPYKQISLQRPGEHYEDDKCKNYLIDSIVIPLYPKIYLEATLAKSLLLQVLTDDYVGHQFADGFILRFYLASSRSFKQHVSTMVGMEDGLKSNIFMTKMPKFIWCGEVYSQEKFEAVDKITDGLIILDATEANKESIDALIFAGYPDRCITLNENNFVILHYNFNNFHYFSNLK
jgi:hypothetical protein